MTLHGVTWRDDGTAAYTTVDGDMVDHLCWRHYGQAWGTVEQVLAGNPGLADHGPVLPAGITILLPRMAPRSGPPRREVVRLFD
ncbi:tail protein X [Roseospira visakhapatnamensis]|uniref:Phage tail protein X n=1 Tax=Roseospira visakhapatnamensis TaxID=390880 RepID=A0A7W6WBC8_9PROT|nr:tail protein X [Roseospira visakhapatnamensis]MBB4267366.1 phage tail protein X [Roseospira visakhapatnamensis]